MEEKSIQVQIGQRIRYYRKSAGYSLSQFAAYLNKSRSSLSKYERGEVSPDLETLQEIAKYLNISLLLLMDIGDTWEPQRLFRIDDKSNLSQQKLLVYLKSMESSRILAPNLLLLEGNSASLYSYYEDLKNYTRCKYHYRGRAEYLGLSTRVFLANTVNQNDIIVIDFADTLSQSPCFPGFFCSLSLGQYRPFAAKCLISYLPLKEDEVLNHLRLTPEETQLVRKKSTLQVKHI